MRVELEILTVFCGGVILSPIHVVLRGSGGKVNGFGFGLLGCFRGVLLGILDNGLFALCVMCHLLCSMWWGSVQSILSFVGVVSVFCCLYFLSVSVSSFICWIVMFDVCLFLT